MKILPEKLLLSSCGILLGALAVGALIVNDAPIGLLDEINALGIYGERSLRWRIAVPRPEAGWKLATLIGTIFGAVFAGMLARDFKREIFYSEAGTSSLVGRTVGSAWRGILGGVLVMVGIRISGDSVWGHLAGAIQLGTGSWLFLIALAIGGVFTALLMQSSGDSAPAEKVAAPTKKRRARK